VALKGVTGIGIKPHDEELNRYCSVDQTMEDAVCVAYGERENSRINFVEEDPLVRHRRRWHDTTKRVLGK
jgi:hypothetical protein